MHLKTKQTAEYLEFSIEDDDDALVGLYDTKERKILIEPRFSDVSVDDDDHIRVWERDGEYGVSDFRQYYFLDLENKKICS